jgi:hypothetical protein
VPGNVIFTAATVAIDALATIITVATTPVVHLDMIKWEVRSWFVQHSILG